MIVLEVIIFIPIGFQYFTSLYSDTNSTIKYSKVYITLFEWFIVSFFYNSMTSISLKNNIQNWYKLN